MSRRKGPTPRKVWQELQRAVPVAQTSELAANLNRERGSSIWMNDVYTVHRTPVDPDIGLDGIVELSIRRNDRKPCRDWRDFQRIKTQLVGAEREAVELYPAESRLMDTANQFYLWVAPAGTSFAVGFDAPRNVATPAQAAKVGAVQRELDPDVEPTWNDDERDALVARAIEEAQQR